MEGGLNLLEFTAIYEKNLCIAEKIYTRGVRFRMVDSKEFFKI